MELYTAKTDRQDRPAWRASKAIGDTAEILAAHFFRSIGLLVSREYGHAGHDLTISGKIEVKNDRLAMNSGYIAVEIQYRGAPSGISTSEATGWAYLVGEELMLTTTAALRELVVSGRYRMVSAGEDARVVLVPLADIRRISRSQFIRGAA
jgi:hypothetical protein